MANRQSTIFATLKNMKKFPVQSVNLTRAKEFKEFTVVQLQADGLSLFPILDKTIKRRILNLGGPLYDTGEIAKAMKTKNNKNDGEAGYYANNTEMHSRTKLTNFDLAVIHSTHETKPRPFLLNSAVRFEHEKDDDIVEKAFDEFWKNV